MPGGSVNQLTSKSTAVTLNKLCGQITTSAENMVGAGYAIFLVNNTTVVATDTINLSLSSVSSSVPGNYRHFICGVSAGSFGILVENRLSTALAETLVFNFAVVKAVNA